MEHFVFHTVCILLFLRPHMGSPIVATYGADFVIIGLMSLGLLIKPTNFDKKLRPLLIANISFLLVLAVISIINAITGDHPIATVVNFGRFFYYSWFFWFLLSIMGRVPDLTSSVIRVLKWTYLVIFFVSVIQLFDLPILSNPVKVLFGSVKLRTLWSGYPRVYGTFYNANWFGVYLVFIALGWVSLLRLKHISLYQFLLRGISVLFLVIISGSRTALLGLTVAGTTLLLLNFGFGQLLWTAFSGSLFIYFLPLISNKYPLLAKTIARFETALMSLRGNDLLNDELTSGRASLWIISTEAVLAKPIFGYGDPGNPLPHNSYLTILLSFGLLGFCAFLFFLLFAFSFVTRLQTSRSDKLNVQNQWVFSFITGLATMSFAAEFIYTTQVMLVLLFLLAWWVSATICDAV